jgi:hypothetical protein
VLCVCVWCPAPTCVQLRAERGARASSARRLVGAPPGLARLDWAVSRQLSSHVTSRTSAGWGCPCPAPTLLVPRESRARGRETRDARHAYAYLPFLAIVNVKRTAVYVSSTYAVPYGNAPRAAAPSARARVLL